MVELCALAVSLIITCGNSNNKCMWNGCMLNGCIQRQFEFATHFTVCKVLPPLFSHLMSRGSYDTFMDSCTPLWQPKKPRQSSLTRVTHLLRVKPGIWTQLCLTSQPGSFHQDSAHLSSVKRVRLWGLRIYRPEPPNMVATWGY